MYSYRSTKEWGRIRAIFGPTLIWVSSCFTRCKISQGIVWWQNKAVLKEFWRTFASNTAIHFCTVNIWFTHKRIRHVCFSQLSYFKAKIMSNDYQSRSLSLVKISARTVKFLLSNSIKLIRSLHKDHTVLLSLICTSVHCFLNISRKEKTHMGF